MAFPEIGRGLPNGLRVFSVANTPFRLLYRADTALGIIQILAVWHGARQWHFGPD